MTKTDIKKQPIKLEYLHTAVVILMQGSIAALNVYFTQNKKYALGKINPVDVGIYVGRKIPLDPSYKHYVSYYGDIGTAVREDKLHDYVNFMKEFADSNTNLVINTLEVEMPDVMTLLKHCEENPDKEFRQSVMDALEGVEKDDLGIIPITLNKDIEDLQELVISTVTGVVHENKLSKGFVEFLLRDGEYDYNYLASSVLSITYAHLDHLNHISKRKKRK